ncbi:MAG: hypothetical protein ACK4SX_00900 [Alcanivoracaceae bacterium]
MKYRALLVALPLAAMIGTANAQPRTSEIRDNGFSWNYVQFGIVTEDWDGGFDRDALYGRLSYALDEHLFLRGSVSLYDGDAGNRGYYGVGLSGGLGFHTPLQRNLDLVLTGDVLHDRYKVGGNRDRENGFRGAGGIRHRTSDQIELSGGAFMQRMYRDNEIGLYGEMLVKVTPTFDVGADLQFGDDVTAVGVFGRVGF